MAPLTLNYRPARLIEQPRLCDLRTHCRSGSNFVRLDMSCLRPLPLQIFIFANVSTYTYGMLLALSRPSKVPVLQPSHHPAGGNIPESDSPPRAVSVCG